MKPKEYVKKYELNINDKFNHNEFVGDLTIDFMSLLEVGKAQENIKGFENAVRAIRMKWDGVNNKTLGQLPDKLWGYFYATVIGPLKDQLFPEIKARRKQEYEEHKAQRDFYKEEKQRMDDWMWAAFFGAHIRAIFKNMLIPRASFGILGLELDASKEEVQHTFRKLSMTLHPDKGGSANAFNRIVEAKNKCLSYLNSR